MGSDTEEEVRKQIATLLSLSDLEDRKMSPENRKAYLNLYEFMKAKGSKPRTIAKHLYCFRKFIRLLPTGLRADKLTQKEMESAIAKVEDLRLSELTKLNIKVVVKSFYKHFRGEDYFYPKEVAWIKTTLPNSKKILPEDILSEKEILQMISSASSLRDKTLVAVLFDSGIRVGELTAMRKKDVNLETIPAHIRVNGKTGARQIPIFFSKPYLAQYINTLNNYEPDEPLFCDAGSWKKMKWPMGRSGVAKVLRAIGKEAGIQKRIYPHLFRHSRASYYANKLTEQQLKQFFGWSGSSKMASTYVHLSGRDIDGAILEANGEELPAKKERSELKSKKCPACREENGVEFQYCSRCGSPLDISVAMQQEKDKELLFGRLAIALKDEKDFKKFIETIKQKKA